MEAARNRSQSLVYQGRLCVLFDTHYKYSLGRSTALNGCNLVRSDAIRILQLIYASWLERRAKLPLKHYAIVEWILQGTHFKFFSLQLGKESRGGPWLLPPCAMPA
jgi:hypothetical protein